MSDRDYQNFTKKLDDGLMLAHQRMLEEKALRGESIVVSTEEGGIQYIPAREILESI